eukprot:TRINITY_DN3516_c0_g1_i7.p1 TRINITY_DN3516_c0_g1~~TRINITY_DN3516_c0_g1_i7.p1  ORF type:complete len:797 (+),score=149.47 TRINITY_DN3516_c0_g1_i7:19-2409(+)
MESTHDKKGDDSSTFISLQQTDDLFRSFDSICEAIETNPNEEQVKTMIEKGYKMGIPFSKNYVMIENEMVKKPYARYLLWRGESVFVWMVIRGSIELIRWFIELCSFDRRMHFHRSHQLSRALRKAWKKRDREMVLLLLSIGAKPDDLEGDDDNAMIVEAYLEDDIEIVNKLLDNGARVDSPRGLYEYKISLLGAAIEKHDTAFVEQLLNKYNARHSFVKPTSIKKGWAVSGNLIDGYYYYSALHLAVAQNHIDIVILLIKKGCDVNVLTRTSFDFNGILGPSALQLAVKNENIEIMKYLIANGACQNTLSATLSAYNRMSNPTFCQFFDNLDQWKKTDQQNYVLITTDSLNRTTQQRILPDYERKDIFRQYEQIMKNPIDPLEIVISEEEISCWHILYPISDRNHPLFGFKLHLRAYIAPMAWQYDTACFKSFETDFMIPNGKELVCHKGIVKTQLERLRDQLQTLISDPEFISLENEKIKEWKCDVCEYDAKYNNRTGKEETKDEDVFESIASDIILLILNYLTVKEILRASEYSPTIKRIAERKAVVEKMTYAPLMKDTRPEGKPSSLQHVLGNWITIESYSYLMENRDSEKITIAAFLRTTNEKAASYAPLAYYSTISKPSYFFPFIGSPMVQRDSIPMLKGALFLMDIIDVKLLASDYGSLYARDLGSLADKFKPEMVIKKIPRLMDGIIINLFGHFSRYNDHSGKLDSLHNIWVYASAYHAFLKMLCLYPELQSNIDNIINSFISDENNRHKSKTPSMGRWLILFSLCSVKHDMNEMIKMSCKNSLIDTQ